jgi:hypothetical protein
MRCPPPAVPGGGAGTSVLAFEQKAEVIGGQVAVLAEFHSQRPQKFDDGIGRFVLP